MRVMAGLGSVSGIVRTLNAEITITQEGGAGVQSIGGQSMKEKAIERVNENQELQRDRGVYKHQVRPRSSSLGMQNSSRSYPQIVSQLKDPDKRKRIQAKMRVNHK